MKQIRAITISFLILISCFQIRGQELKSDTDSLTVIQIVNEFYEWYIHSTKKEKNEENRPVFNIDEENISLNLSRYLQNLKKLNFSDSLINREILDYKNCEQNLKNITKEEFAKFDNILDFEDIGCGFDNSYKWIGGQEMCDGIKIINVMFLNRNKCHVYIEYFSINGNEKSFWGNKSKIVLLIINGEWKINDIKI